MSQQGNSGIYLVLPITILHSTEWARGEHKGRADYDWEDHGMHPPTAGGEVVRTGHGVSEEDGGEIDVDEAVFRKTWSKKLECKDGMLCAQHKEEQREVHLKKCIADKFKPMGLKVGSGLFLIVIAAIVLLLLPSQLSAIYWRASLFKTLCFPLCTGKAPAPYSIQNFLLWFCFEIIHSMRETSKYITMKMKHKSPP